MAETLGKFQNQLADYPASTLHETIARFHDTPNRYANFEKALAADALGRAKTIAPEIAFIHAREKDCHVLLDQLAAGEIPLRVTHNDTKINNVLLDEATGKGICVIDLDTVMPGLSAYDFGDSIRTGANDCAEDEPDQSKVHFDLHLYEVFAKGYLSTAGSTMHTAEKKSLAWGAKLMTLECGIRYILSGGRPLFPYCFPLHNLDRARTQFGWSTDGRCIRSDADRLPGQSLISNLLHSDTASMDALLFITDPICSNVLRTAGGTLRHRSDPRFNV